MVNGADTSGSLAQVHHLSPTRDAFFVHGSESKPVRRSGEGAPGVGKSAFIILSRAMALRFPHELSGGQWTRAPV
jgi:hypothetical protein